MKEGGGLDSYGHILVHDCLSSYWTMNKPENRARAEAGAPAPAPPERGTPPLRPWMRMLAPSRSLTPMRCAASTSAGSFSGSASTDTARRGKAELGSELVCFLRSLNSMRKESLERGGKSFRRKTMDIFRKRFDELVEEGLAANEAAEELKGSATLRKTRTLPRRLEKRKDDFLRFLKNFDVPFTSCETERDLRSHKGRMAISGCFRTVRGLASHANLSTVIKTLMKAGKSRLEAADAAVNGRPVDLLPPPRSPELES